MANKRRHERPIEPTHLDEGEVDEVNEITAQSQRQSLTSKGTSGLNPNPNPDHSLESFLAETFNEDIPDIPAPKEGELPSINWIKQNFRSKSAAIRYLISQGHPRKQIANLLNVKYQHVRNVEVTHLKRGPNEPWDPEVRKAMREANQKLNKER